MKTAVHFGAGKIGRGFIADLLHDSGYKIVFADVVQPLVDLVNETHEYSLFLIDHDYEEKVIVLIDEYDVPLARKSDRPGGGIFHHHTGR